MVTFLNVTSEKSSSTWKCHQTVEVESKQEDSDDDVEAQAGNEVDDNGDLAVRISDTRNDDYNGSEGEASCKRTSVVAETDSGMEKVISGGASMGREVALVMRSMNVQNGGNRPVDDVISNLGLMKSLSGSDLIRPGLDIEVVLTKAHELNYGET
ncbi:hypothetical protein CsSME_00034585 [Camellia sinensis var. sinensis]